jgi:arsenate reductase
MTQEDAQKSTQPDTRPPSVLFICTGNTARSQISQVLLEHHAGDRFRVTSAGLEPGEINPLTVRVLEERGLPTGHLQAKGVRPLLGEHFTYVVTVCDRAEANCPASRTPPPGSPGPSTTPLPLRAVRRSV